MTLLTIYSRFTQLMLLLLVVLVMGCSSDPLPIPTPPASNPPNLTQANIYINQIAFDVEAPKQAVISLPRGEQASRFVVYQDSDVVFQGQLTPQPTFDEWGQGAQYYLADFSSVQRTGDFHITVNTLKKQLTSSTFTIKQNAYFTLTAKSLIKYFNGKRHTDPKDKSVRVYGTEKFVDLSGGWVSSGNTQEKYLSNLSASNFLVSQQAGFAAWSMAKSYSTLNILYDREGLTPQLAEEVMWGADYLHRSLSDEGYFYSGVVDTPIIEEKEEGLFTNMMSIIGSEDDEIHLERSIASFDRQQGIYTNNFQAAFREGGGMAIAALARAYELSKETDVQGEFSAEQYLITAERAFNHLELNNLRYADDDKENIIDDYTALIAAIELYRITDKDQYLKAARYRAHNLNSRMTSHGSFVSDEGERLFYHAVEIGLPVIALTEYLSIENNRQIKIKTRRTIKLALDYQLALSSQVSNPFNLARQKFSTFESGIYSKPKEGFFMPHANDAYNWWQGENSRMASLTAAAIWGGKITHSAAQSSFGIKGELANFAQSQVDWILGKNPYQISMLYGFGITNPTYTEGTGPMLNGGISSGITGASLSPDGRGITWAEGPDESNWRWAQQRLGNSAWYLLAITAMTDNSL